MSLPKHIVIVPDGNRRWAKKRKKLSLGGHEEGAKNSQKIIKAIFDAGVGHLTIWGSSVSNVTLRSRPEVTALMKVFEKSFKDLCESEEVQENKVKVEVLGRWQEFFPDKIKKYFKQAIQSTKSSNGPRLTFLMAYDGRDEMESAIQAIQKSGGKVTKEKIKENLWTRDLPEVDLVIRTGGEPHWSAGLMMWDVAEARLHFTETLWPDFSEKELKEILKNYANTERRRGR